MSKHDRLPHDPEEQHDPEEEQNPDAGIDSVGTAERDADDPDESMPGLDPILPPIPPG